MIPEQQSSATTTEENEEGIADQVRAGLEARVIELIILGYYIKKGLIDRYLTEKDYAAGSSWGGMIGYIFAGQPIYTVEKINCQIERQLNQLDAVYVSLHKRPNTTEELKITHLLLPYTQKLPS